MYVFVEITETFIVWYIADGVMPLGEVGKVVLRPSYYDQMEERQVRSTTSGYESTFSRWRSVVYPMGKGREVHNGDLREVELACKGESLTVGANALK